MYSELQSTQESDDLCIIGTLKEYSNFYHGFDTEAYKYSMNLLMEHWTKREKAHILEIGAGAGFTVDRLHPHFTNISLIEPNPFLRHYWKHKSWFRNADNKHLLRVYPNTIQEVIKTKQIQPNSVDVIILYHCVYHFEIKNLKQTLDEIISWLKADGVCLITVLDDDNEFIQRIFRSVSPNYALSAMTQNILHQNNWFGAYYLKYREVISLDTTLKEYLFTLKWITLQTCMNQNYFSDGLTEKQLRELDSECIQYIDFIQSKSNDVEIESSYSHNSETSDDCSSADMESVNFKNELKSIHFIFKKNGNCNSKSSNYDVVFTSIGALVALLVLFAVCYWSMI